MRLQTLFQEERAAYEAALEDARDTDGNIDPLAALQHAATYQHHLASLIEIILGALQLPAWRVHCMLSGCWLMCALQLMPAFQRAWANHLFYVLVGPTLHSLRMHHTQTVLQRQQLDALEPVLFEAVQAQREQQQQQHQAEAQQSAPQQQTVSAPAVSHMSVSQQPVAHAPALASQLAAALSSGAQLSGGPPAPPAGSSFDPAVNSSTTTTSSEPWGSSGLEPWTMSQQEVTDAAKARLAAEDHSGALATTSAPVQISQSPTGSAAQHPDGTVGSPDVFEDLFFSHLTLNDYGQVVPTTAPGQPPSWCMQDPDSQAFQQQIQDGSRFEVHLESVIWCLDILRLHENTCRANITVQL